MNNVFTNLPVTFQKSDLHFYIFLNNLIFIDFNGRHGWNSHDAQLEMIKLK